MNKPGDRAPDADRAPVLPVALGKRNRRFIIIAAALLWGGSLLLWAERGVDRLVLVAHNALRADPFVAGLFSAIAKYGMSFVLLLYLAYLAFFMKGEERRDAHKIYLLIILSWSIAGAAGEMLKVMVLRTRPFIEYAGQISAVIRPKTSSFPSGHSTKSLALVLPFLLFVCGKPLASKFFKALLLIAALAVCYSRIMLGVHYPSDVLAGSGVAFACLPLAVAAVNVFYKRSRISEARARTFVLVWSAIMLFLMLYLPAVS